MSDTASGFDRVIKRGQAYLWKIDVWWIDSWIDLIRERMPNLVCERSNTHINGSSTRLSATPNTDEGICILGKRICGVVDARNARYARDLHEWLIRASNGAREDDFKHVRCCSSANGVCHHLGV